MSGLPPVPEIELTPQPLAFAGDQLSPAPFHFKFTGEDALEIASYNSQTGVRIAVQGRMWNEREGIRPFAFEHVPTTDRSRGLEVFGLPFGYLLNVVIFASSGTPRIGQTFVSLHVIRGRGGARVLLATLLQGYVTAEQELAFPGSPIRHSMEGGSYLRTITGTTPAANANVLETVPTGALWEIRAIRVNYTTSAVVANRRVLLRIGNLTVAWLISVANGDQGATQTYEYFWGPGVTSQVAIPSLAMQSILPVPCSLRAGDLFVVTVSNRQAGDAFDAPVYQVQEWMEAQSL